LKQEKRRWQINFRSKCQEVFSCGKEKKTNTCELCKFSSFLFFVKHQQHLRGVKKHLDGIWIKILHQSKQANSHK
jgi:hypothetical protein